MACVCLWGFGLGCFFMKYLLSLAKLSEVSSKTFTIEQKNHKSSNKKIIPIPSTRPKSPPRFEKKPIHVIVVSR